MVTATITLRKLIQDSQDYGSDEEHMVSRVFFDMNVNGVDFVDLHADIKQSVGSSFEASPLEVSRPRQYEGPFNYEVFRSIVEKYYRGLIGATGVGIHIAGGSGVRMRGNVFHSVLTEHFEVQVAGGPW